jgi:IS30 family transposase
MDEKLRQLIDTMPERPPRSKLEPHAEVIRELRRKRRTYQEIAAFFREHLQLAVAPSTIYEFVKTRARQARKPVSDAEQWVSSGNQASEKPAASAAGIGGDARERIRALRHQPVPAKKERPRFAFDPEQPLTLKPQELKEK